MIIIIVIHVNDQLTQAISLFAILKVMYIGFEKIMNDGDAN